MDNRVIIDPQAFSREAQAWMERLSRGADALGSRRFQEILNKWRQTIDARLSDPYTVVVCGEFKRGKSSLINALLGEDVTPVDVVPETVTYNTLTYGTHASEGVLSGGRRIRLGDDELKRERLEKVSEAQKCRLEQLSLRRPIPALKDIAIVDTPGLNDIADLNPDLMKQALERADAVVYVMTPDSPLSLTEQSFLRNMILPNPALSLFVVANKVDLVDLDGLERLDEAIRRRTDRYLPGQKIYYLSAYAERCRQTGRALNDAAAAEKLNALFDDFRRALQAELATRKDVVLLSRVEHMMTACAAELEEEIDVIRLGADESRAAELEAAEGAAQALRGGDEALRAFADALKAQVDAMEAAARDELAALVARMRDEVATLDAYDEADLEKYYPFYCVDSVRDALNAIMERDEEALYQRIQTAPEFDFLRLPSLGSPDFRFDLDSRVWTKGDSLSMATGWFARSAVVQLLSTYVGGLMREREVAKQTVSLQEKILDIYTPFWQSVQRGVHDVYEAFREEIVKQVSVFLADKQVQLTEREDELARLKTLARDERDRLCKQAAALREEIETMKRELLVGE